MYVINPELVVREDDKTLFSLEDMQIIEFNEIGFECIRILEREHITSCDEFIEKSRNLPDISVSDIKEFWDSLLDSKIVVRL